MLYTDLPVYKECYKLLLAVSRLLKQIPRQWKQTIGNELFTETSTLVITLFKANTERDKRAYYLATAREKCELIHLLLRLLKDLHALSLADFASLQPPLVSIGKQLT
jgi:hypothetical protein